MKKIVLFSIALVLATAAYSQTADRQTNGKSSGSIPFEIKEMVYFENGKLDEYKTVEWDASYSHVNNEARYSASGVLLEQIEFVYQKGKGYIVTKISRDAENKLKSRVVYEYNPRDQLSREKLEDNKRKTISSNEYTYDDRGNRTSRVIKNKSGDKQAETQYVYNENGKMISSTTSGLDGATISSTRYTYDSNGNLIAQEVVDREGNVTSTVRTIWQDGLEVKNETAGADGSVQVRVTNEYGSEGELVKKTIENGQGKPGQTVQYEYTFRPARR